MEIVVNDTNIFIDLYTIGLLEDFFNLPISVHTVDFVVNEITNQEQLNVINNYIDNKKLTVHSFDAKELIEVIELRKNGYDVLDGNRLKEFKLSFFRADDKEVNFLTKTRLSNLFWQFFYVRRNMAERFDFFVV